MAYSNTATETFSVESKDYLKQHYPPEVIFDIAVVYLANATRELPSESLISELDSLSRTELHRRAHAELSILIENKRTQSINQRNHILICGMPASGKTTLKSEIIEKVIPPHPHSFVQITPLSQPPVTISDLTRKRPIGKTATHQDIQSYVQNTLNNVLRLTTKIGKDQNADLTINIGGLTYLLISRFSQWGMIDNPDDSEKICQMVGVLQSLAQNAPCAVVYLDSTKEQSTLNAEKEARGALRELALPEEKWEETYIWKKRLYVFEHFAEIRLNTLRALQYMQDFSKRELGITIPVIMRTEDHSEITYSSHVIKCATNKEVIEAIREQIPFEQRFPSESVGNACRWDGE